jgi:hypothetical protein
MYTMSGSVGPYRTGGHAETFACAALQKSAAGQAAAAGASHLLATPTLRKNYNIAA